MAPLRPITVGPAGANGPDGAAAPQRGPRLSRLPTLPDRAQPAAGREVPQRRLGPHRGHPADYDLTAVLGEGGMGMVWAADQAGLGREVAIKRPRPGPSARRSAEVILAEAELTGSLEHPGIVPVHEVGIDQDGMPFYSMRRLRGRTWAERWSELSQREHLEVLLRVADAIAYAHGQGVLHRDIKPDNVFLGEYGEVVVFDWGLAIRLSDLQAGRVRVTAAGTPAYMAPEMARAQLARLGVASDVYLLGATLYEVLAGKPPHGGVETVEILAAAAENSIVHELPDGELADVARVAMATEPGARFADVRAFQRAVRTCLDHQESIGLTERAFQRLAAVQKDGGHAGFARVVLAFEEALELWPQNRRALDGLSRARLAYAAHARNAGDLELAASLLDDADPAHRPEREALAVRRLAIARRRRLLRILPWSTGGLLVLLLAATTAGLVAVRHQRDQLIQVTQARDAAEARLAQEEAEAGAERRRMWRRLLQEDFVAGVLPPRLHLASGRWEFADGTLLASGPAASSLVLDLAHGGDAQVQLDVHEGGTAAIVFGAEASGVAPGHGLEIELGDRLMVRLDGAEVAAERVPGAAPGLPRRLRAELAGGVLRVLVDGHVAIERTAVARPKAGGVVLGLRAEPGTRIDNLKVEVPWE